MVSNIVRILPAIWMAFIMTFLTSCIQQQHGVGSSQRIHQGQVFLYLSCERKSAVDLSFGLSGIAFKNDTGEWVDISLEKQVESRGLCDRQMKLSEFHLPVGKYQQMKWNISEAVVKKGAKSFSLALPEPQGEHLVDVDFVIFQRESLALFVDWDPEASVLDRYLFKPEMEIRKEGIEIKKILAYVTNMESDAVTVIERQQDIAVATIAVGRRPKGIVANSAGTRVYVASSGSKNISVIDTDARRVINTINNFGYSPSEVVLSGDDRWLYATNPDSDNVSVIDTVSQVVSSRITVGRKPDSLVYDGDRSKIYVTNQGDNTVSVIDADTVSEESTVSVGLQPSGLAVQDDKLYVVNTGSNTVSVIQLGSYAVVKTVNVGQMPKKALAGLSRWIYVSNGSNNEVSFYYTSMDIITKNVSVGDLPTNMALDTLRRKLYVINSLSDNVSVIDLATKKIRSVIEVGRKPYGIALVNE